MANIISIIGASGVDKTSLVRMKMAIAFNLH